MQDDFEKAAGPPLGVWLMRHGTNDKEPCDDGGDSPHLSAQGRREGRAMADFLSARGLDYPVLILSSDFTRNIETGAIVDEALSAGGQTARLSVPAIRSEDMAGMAQVFALMSRLDDPATLAQIGLSAPPRTLILIGNKRNLFLECSRYVIDMKGEMMRQSENPDALAALSPAALQEMAADNDVLQSMLGGDGDMDLFEEGRLVGYELGLSHWREFPDPDRVRLVVDRSFSETGKKWTLFMETRRKAAPDPGP